MSRILLVGTSDAFYERLRQTVGDGFLAVHADPFPSTPHELFELLNGAPKPDIAFLEPGERTDAALALADALVHAFGVVVLLVNERAAELALPALRAGITDVIDPDATTDEVVRAFDRASAQLRPSSPVPPPGPQAPTHRGRVIAVASPKGGVGKTTVATNVAVGLARKAPQSVVLVDLDIHFGDVASALNLNPEYTLPDVTQGAAVHDSVALKSLLTRHETGLFVIPGSDSPAAADAVSPASVTHLLESLAAQFHFVVVDTAPGLSEHTLAVLDATDSLVLVTSLDVPGVRGLRKEIDTLTDVGMVMGQRQIVLNFFEPSRGLSVADVEATIRAKVDVVLPASKFVPVSVNQGIPLLQGELRDPVAKSLGKLVDALAPDEAAPSKGRFGFARRAKGGSS